MTTLKVDKREYQAKEITLDLRMEVLDEAMVAAKAEKFSSFVKIIRKIINITDEKLMELTTTEISNLGQRVVELCNEGKKPTKSK